VAYQRQPRRRKLSGANEANGEIMSISALENIINENINGEMPEKRKRNLAWRNGSA
jgi:hypothetical protein